MKIAHIYFEIPMYYSHSGLKKILKKKVLEDHECAIFINKAWTGLKMLTPENVILYLRRPPNAPIEPDSIKYLPNCVNGTNLNYDAALRAAIQTKFNKKYPTHSEA
jgi:hypothetical protein